MSKHGTEAMLMPHIQRGNFGRRCPICHALILGGQEVCITRAVYAKAYPDNRSPGFIRKELQRGKTVVRHASCI